MNQDLALTGEGMPAIMLGEVRYPLLFSAAAFKKWAEYKGVPVGDVMAQGWDGATLGEEGLHKLLTIALEFGEMRRKMFDSGPVHEITAELVDTILSLFHPSELWLILARAWNEPPVGNVDPQMVAGQDNPSPGII